MNTSEDIKELATALAKAQGELQNASKDGKGNFGKYATLASTLDEIRPVFSKHGLSLVQIPHNLPGISKITLSSMIMHSSGQWIKGEIDLILDKTTMQGLGSALSYARRYTASSMAGIHQDDDDGEEASKTPQRSNPALPTHPMPKAKVPLPNHAPQAKPKDQDLITEDMAAKLWSLSKKKGLKDETVLELFKKFGNVDKTMDLNINDFDRIYAMIEDMSL